MHKEILLTPGPTHVPLRIFQAMSQPTMHHRTEVFKKHFVTAVQGLKMLVRSETDPVILASSGTGALEAALLNTCSNGDKILVVNAGKFGERWIKIANKLALTVIELKAEWGQSISTAELQDALTKHPDLKAVCMQSCETSTAVQHPIADFCETVKKTNPEILTIVDAVSALATLPIYVSTMNIDILAGAAHKGLMLPPGLAMIILSDYAWKIAENVKCPSLYFDLLAERKALQKSTTAWTPAMNHILGLNESLSMIHEEGEENVYRRHALMSSAARAALKALKLEILGDRFPSPAVTAAFTPPSIDAEKLRKIMLEKSGVRIAGGQDHLKGKIFRIGHMGHTSQWDLLSGIGALELALKESGYEFNIGDGSKAALAAFAGK